MAEYSATAPSVRVVAAEPAGVPMYQGWESFDPETRGELWQKMVKALDAQQRSRHDLAGPLYEEVVSRAPMTFDAVHMLGVVRLMEGDLDGADALLTRARDLIPGNPMVRHNLQLLAVRRREHEGLYSLRSIVACDMLRLFGMRMPVLPDAPNPFSPQPGAPFHVVIPGDVGGAGSNRTGSALARNVGAAATLWSGPASDSRIATELSALQFGIDESNLPNGGSIVVFGLNPRVLDWLPFVAASFESIVIALDAHDHPTCVDLLGRLSPGERDRVRFAARSAAVLDDLGLQGTVDPMLFDVRTRSPRPDSARLRVGVFIPALGNREDAIRWAMLEWLRAQDIFLRVLYAGRLPSRHIANADEHLLGLVTDWPVWCDGLDALFYWGAGGHMRQYDRLVFEAIDAGIVVVADGFGDFGAQFGASPDCIPFFDSDAARAAMTGVLSRLAGRKDAEDRDCQDVA